MRKFLTLLILCRVLSGNSQDFSLSPYSNSTSGVGVIGVGDVDKDGYVDLIITETNSLASDIFLLKNDKTSNVSSFNKQFISQVYISGKPSLVDLELDGDLDIVYGSALSKEIEILINDGKGKFAPKSLGVGGADLLRFMDMDKDGDLDIVGINESNKTLTLFSQQPGLVFANKSLLPSNTSLSDCALGDLDNDGLPEIILSYYSFNGIQLIYLENKGFNTISYKTLIKGKYSEINRIKISDLNNDGKNDIVIIDRYDLVIAKNEGNFIFTEKKINPSGSGSIVGADFAEVNGDGKMDFLICTIFNSIWLKNTDKINFTYETGNISNATGTRDFHFGDFNKDGAMDFAYSSNGLKIMINKVPQLPSNINDIQTLLKVYPNPAKDQIYVDGIDVNNLTAYFYNQLGMLIHEVSFKGGQLDMSMLSPGPYVFTLIDSTGKVVGRSRIVKE